MSFPPSEALTNFPKRINAKDVARYEGKFACYSLVPIPDTSTFLDAVNKDDAMYNDGYPDAYMMLPPEYDFTSRTLSDIVDYHVKLTGKQSKDQEYEDSIDSNIFIVAINQDCIKHGVLIVDLCYQNYSDDVYVAAVARCALEAKCQQEEEFTVSALGWCVNIGVGNMGCEEMVEDVEKIVWAEPVPGYTELQQQLRQSAHELKEEARLRFSKLPVRHSRYVVHDVRCTQPVNMTRGMLAIDPDGYYKDDVDMDDRVAVTYGINSTSTDDTVESMWLRVRKEHPVHCASNYPYSEPFWQVDKFWMFVYEAPSTEDDGVQVTLVKVIWDGVTEGKSKEELDSILPDVQIMERCEPSRALQRMDQISMKSTV